MFPYVASLRQVAFSANLETREQTPLRLPLPIECVPGHGYAFQLDTPVESIRRISLDIVSMERSASQGQTFVRLLFPGLALTELPVDGPGHHDLIGPPFTAHFSEVLVSIVGVWPQPQEEMKIILASIRLESSPTALNLGYECESPWIDLRSIPTDHLPLLRSVDPLGILIKSPFCYQRFVREESQTKWTSKGLQSNIRSLQRRALICSFSQIRTDNTRFPLLIETPVGVPLNPLGSGVSMTSSQLKRILSLWLEIDQSLQASSDLKQALIDFNLSNFAAFDNGKIRLVDFGSIQSCEDPYTGILDIITKGLPVLKIKALSPDLEMSSIYHEWIENSSTRHGVSMSSPIADITNWLELDFTYRSTRQDITKNIEDWLSKIETPDRRDFWSTYGSGLTYGSVRDLQLDPPESEKLQARSLTRVETVISILSSMPRGSLLDLGCARGMFSEQAAAMGFAVVALDGCESSISEIDTRLEGHRELNLVALPATFLPDNLHSPNFDSTWQFDVVLCLALSHHLLLGEFSAVQRKSFSVQELAEMLHRVCRRNLLVEFMEHGLGSPINNMANVPNPLPDWYTLENLESHLSDYFQVIERVRYEEEQQRHRTLLVCEKQPIL